MDNDSMQPVRSLAACSEGQEVEVVEVAQGASPEAGDSAVCPGSAVAVRLGEIGMVPGAVLRIMRQGSPMIVELGNTRFCLRSREAALVTVRPTGAAPPHRLRKRYRWGRATWNT